jgi:tetratricopeptide (TPR) repeat protein
MNRIIGLVLAACLVSGWSVTCALAQTSTQPSDAPDNNVTAKISMDKVKVLMARANDALLKGDEDGADKILADVVEIARQAYDLGDAAASEAIFRQVLNLKSDNADALLGLAELYRRINPIWAVEYYTRYKAINPSDPAVYYGRGSCYLERDAYALAIEDLKYLVDRLEPNHLGGLTNLALAYRGRAVEKNYDPDLFEQAVYYMRQAVTVAQNSDKPEIQKMLPDLKYRLGRLTFEYQQILARAKGGQGNFDEATELLEQSIQESEKTLKEGADPVAMNQILLNYDSLSEIYNAQIQLDPKDPNPYIKLADIASKRAGIVVMQGHATAIEYIKKSLEVDPGVAENWVKLAQQYDKLGLTKNTIAALDKAIELDPGNAGYKAARAKLTATTQPSSQPTSKP